MKKALILITLLGGLILTSITSCNKGDEPTPQTIDSVKSILPKQIVIANMVPNQDSLRLSLKYDTVNRKVELYEDDPSTPDIFDKLIFTSSFNSNGYLIGYEVNYTDESLVNLSGNETITISRDGDNTINYIADYDRDENQKDTTFYKYETTSNGTKITTQATDPYVPLRKDTTYFDYDKDNKLLSFGNPGSTVNCQFDYNSNGSISKVAFTGKVDHNYDNLSEFSYSSGLPDDKEDMMGRILMGKDYYLWDLKELNPFTFYLDADFDNYPLSITDPYHFTRMQDTHRPTDFHPDGIEGLNISYELNENKLLYKVSVKYDGNDNTGVLIFKY